MFSPKSLGYDRGHIYSPDGRLYQVEYANEAVRRGSNCLGLIGKDGIVLIAQKKVSDIKSKLITIEGKEKIFPIEEHIILTGSGLLGDLQWLVSYSRVQAQNLRLIYGEPAGVPLLVKNLASLLLNYTQISGYRPFGVSIILTGINHGKAFLYKIEPSGSYFNNNAVVIGEGMEDITKYLEEYYNPQESISDQIISGLKAFKVQNLELESNQVEIVQIQIEEPILFNRLTNKEIETLFNEI
ncbi:MAG: Proteasome subunit alpha [Candidatus Heimdallarchaeota archaeon LC_3]|nr:MAG: Proteasome subunit alpha [Candidatus Heimdallarchaeota archaeon LC_3]